MKMTTKRLIQAALILEEMTGKEITAIQFEDGSGKKFNYSVAGESGWRFKDLSDHFA